MKRRGIVFAVGLTLLGALLGAGDRETDHPSFHESISPEQFEAAILENAVIDIANKARIRNRLLPCRIDSILCASARGHSIEMAGLGYFSHQSPLSKNETLEKRLENAGLDSIRAAGENLGVDYVLDIAGVTYYPEHRNGRNRFINSQTGKAIPKQTYEQFARHMVEDWLLSPQHRDNLLDARFSRMGVGAAMGELNELDAVFVTQLFTTSDSCKDLSVP